MPRISLQQFCANTDDNLHCFQACYKMVYDYFHGTNISMEQAELDTGFIPGKASWQYRGLSNLATSGLDVIQMDDFPVSQFTENPENSLQAYTNNNQQVIDYIMNESDIDEAILSMKLYRYTSGITDITNQPTFDDIKRLLSLGYMLIVNVNSMALVGKQGYCGHFVIIDFIRDDVLTIHNPGLPPMYNQQIAKDDFLRAWEMPALMAIKRL